MPKQHWAETMADELAAYIEQESDRLAEGLLDGGKAPFAQQTTAAQRAEFYRRQLYNPDGSPNLEGRARVMQRLGPNGYADTVRGVLKTYPELAATAPRVPEAFTPDAPQEGGLPL